MAAIRLELVRYRFERANAKLSASRDLIRTGHFADSVGSSYFAIFSAMRALLLLKDVSPKTHEGAITLFNKYFVLDKMFPAGINKLINDAKDIRERSDYGDFFIVERNTALEYLVKAEQFVKRAEEVLTEILLKNEKLNGKNGKK